MLLVAQDVVVDGVTIFPHGAEAHGRVTTIKQPGFMGKPPGEFSWTMEYVTAVNGDPDDKRVLRQYARHIVKDHGDRGTSPEITATATWATATWAMGSRRGLGPPGCVLQRAGGRPSFTRVRCR